MDAWLTANFVSSIMIYGLGSCYAYIQRDRRGVRQKRSASTLSLSPLFSNSLIYSKFAFSALPASRSGSRREEEEEEARVSAKGKSADTLRFARRVIPKQGTANYRITRDAV